MSVSDGRRYSFLEFPLVATIIIGNTNNAKVKLPANILLPRFISLTKISSPSKPYITDGTPLNLIYLTSRREDNLLLFPYSPNKFLQQFLMEQPEEM